MEFGEFPQPATMRAAPTKRACAARIDASRWLRVRSRKSHALDRWENPGEWRATAGQGKGVFTITAIDPKPISDIYGSTMPNALRDTRPYLLRIT
jgi:hypothetical protein